MPEREPLIIVGSSVRAAAQSAVRAGFSPWCIDQFGDRDLAEITADARTVSDWPAGIELPFAEAPIANWIYTGALENDAKLVARLSETRPLLGCDHETLSRLRDPTWLANTLTKASLPSLPIIVPASSVPESGEWMVKPLASAAGIGVRNFDEGIAEIGCEDHHFLQKRATGRSISGLYLGSVKGVKLLGMCEQLCRGPAAGAGCYIYAGSVGPLSTDDIPQRAFHQAQQIGSAISNWLAAEGTHFKGLFGIDFILDESSGDLWTLEVNPRYPASAELYERGLGWPMIRWHVDVCRHSYLPTVKFMQQVSGGKNSRKQGKLIVYARKDFIAPDFIALTAPLTVLNDGNISVADIPQTGTPIRKDEPVCTILTAQENIAKCHETLTTASDALLKLIDEIAE